MDENVFDPMTKLEAPDTPEDQLLPERKRGVRSRKRLRFDATDNCTQAALVPDDNKPSLESSKKRFVDCPSPCSPPFTFYDYSGKRPDYSVHWKRHRDCPNLSPPRELIITETWRWIKGHLIKITKMPRRE